ncbi:hypothetical protein COV20_05910 [Candidatus Woesearchaeota archaeon CG10_big_fil_rev_8_21_14_0_10_45_16]|nr:MAG: hypothetical protein COV20_05910 [Candidatus Woesearchaeota archaeon CG10_big_fil_rev_8_21_14_0_10_45_16]
MLLLAGDYLQNVYKKSPVLKRMRYASLVLALGMTACGSAPQISVEECGRLYNAADPVVPDQVPAWCQNLVETSVNHHLSDVLRVNKHSSFESQIAVRRMLSEVTPTQCEGLRGSYLSDLTAFESSFDTWTADVEARFWSLGREYRMLKAEVTEDLVKKKADAEEYDCNR